MHAAIFTSALLARQLITPMIPIPATLSSGPVFNTLPTQELQPAVAELVIPESIPGLLSIMPTRVPHPADADGKQDAAIDRTAVTIQKPIPPHPFTTGHGPVVFPTRKVTPFTGPLVWYPPTSSMQGGAESTLVTVVRPQMKEEEN